MMALLYLLAIFLLFGLSIFVHELGHFLAARRLGLQADVFSIGLGPAVWKRQIGATVWKIGWIPFGGYVALPQMDPNGFLEGEGVRSAKSAGQHPVPSGSGIPPSAALPRVAPWRKIIVSLAGAFGNVVFAFVLATVVWLVGKPSALSERNGVIGFIATNSPALALGVAVGDEILAVDGRPVANWTQIYERAALGPGSNILLRLRAPDGSERELALPAEPADIGVRSLPGLAGMDPCLVAAVEPDSGAAAAGLRGGDLLVRYAGQLLYSRAHLSQLIAAGAGRPAPLEFRRDGQTLAVEVVSSYDAKLQRHRIGIQFNTLGDLDYTTRAHPTPWAQVRDHATAIFRFLDALTTPRTSGAAADALGGPLMILVMLWYMLQSSFILAVWFTGFLNVNLAILNLLPVPVLDGGHVVLNIYEWIFRRPPPPKLVTALVNLFAVLFIALFLVLVFRDSARLIVPPVRHWLSGAP